MNKIVSLVFLFTVFSYMPEDQINSIGVSGGLYMGDLYGSDALESNKFGVNELAINEFFVFPGLYLNITPNRKLSSQLELWYKHEKFSSTQLSIENRSIFIPLILKRDFLFYNKISPYINAGLSYNYHFYFTVDELNMEYSIVENRGSSMLDTRNISKQDYDYIQDNHSSLGVLIGCGINEIHS